MRVSRAGEQSLAPRPTAWLWLPLKPSLLRALILLFLASAASSEEQPPAARAVPILLPDEDGKLVVQAEGMNYLRSLGDREAHVVAAIGPYRSGKSFLLNQLLGKPCREGFGVGHQRHTQTRGVWLWGEPQLHDTGGGGGGGGAGQAGGSPSGAAIVYMDTEGFEAAGKSMASDDRIFALSALVSSVLIYNLPETIKESDLRKLSFAVDLSKGFYKKALAGKGGFAGQEGLGGGHQKSLKEGSLKKEEAAKEDDGRRAGSSVQFPSLVWLIQHDFLGGSGVQEYLEKEVLAEVKHATPAGTGGGGHHGRYHQDAEETHAVAELNRIRRSLRVFPKHVGRGLALPHLDRTKLCDLPDSELNPVYREQRAELRQTVNQLALSTPKVVGGKTLTGPELADFFNATATALSEGEIPSVGSVIAAFNKDIVSAALDKYSQVMEGLLLPLSAQSFDAGEAVARREAVAIFLDRSFGVEEEEGEEGSGEKEGERGSSGGGPKTAQLLAALVKPLAQFVERNKFSSYRTCDSTLLSCSTAMDSLSETVLPSMAKFDDTSRSCNASFQMKCQGPSRQEFEGRQATSLKRDKGRFFADYNARLLQSLIVCCLAVALIARFAVPTPLVELLGWLGFAFFEVGPKLLTVGGGGSFYVTHHWRLVTNVYEGLVYNSFYDLTDTRQSVPIVCVLVLSGLLFRFRHRRAVYICAHQLGCGRMVRGQQRFKAALPMYADQTSPSTVKDAFA